MRASDSLSRSSATSCLLRALSSASSAARMANDVFSTSAAAVVALARASSRAAWSCSTLGASPAPPDAVREPKHVATLRHRDHMRLRGDERAARGEVIDHRDPAKGGPHGLNQAVRPAYEVRRPRGSGGKRHVGVGDGCGTVGDHEASAPSVLVAQPTNRVNRVLDRVHGQRVGEGAERRGNSVGRVAAAPRRGRRRNRAPRASRRRAARQPRPCA